MTLFTLGRTSDIGRRWTRICGQDARFTSCGGAYASVEQKYDDTPRAGIRDSAFACLDEPHAVPTRLGHIGLLAQGEPDLPGRHAVLQGLRGGAIVQRAEGQVCHEGRAAAAELGGDGARELAALHVSAARARAG